MLNLVRQTILQGFFFMHNFASKSEVPKNFTGCCEIFERSETRYYLNGELHRVDGPAVINKDGSEEWWQFGYRHRLDGPAVRIKQVVIVSYKNSVVKYHDTWWYRGKKFSSEQEFLKNIKVQAAMIDMKLLNIENS